MAKRRPRKRQKRTKVTPKTQIPTALIPSVFSPFTATSDNSSGKELTPVLLDSTSSSGGVTSWTTSIKSEKKPLSMSTKFVSGFINMIPDGMLLKVGSLIFGKLIGKIPEDKREQFWEGLEDYSIKLAGAVTEGAARGVASEVKDNYSR